MTACARCLKRAALLGLLAPWIARSTAEHRRLGALLALPDDELIDAVCREKRDQIDRRLGSFDPGEAERDAAVAGLWAICRHARSFPGRLLDAADGPALLYGRGDPAAIERLTEERPAAVVGSRRASAYGLEVARGLSRELAACGVPVVSGMALGVDSAAHEGALERGGLTVAVLAGGADVPYPRSKRALYREIAATGLVVSELPPGARPFRWSFPARNRIMAALSAMTVVVEGTRTSGSLITARFAADLGREVGAVPGHVTSALAGGPNDLIGDGAHVVRSAADVLDTIYGLGAATARKQAARSGAELDGHLRSLLDAVERGQGSIDAIATDSAEVADILAGLTELELLGLVRRGAGGRYVRSVGT